MTEEVLMTAEVWVVCVFKLLRHFNATKSLEMDDTDRIRRGSEPQLGVSSQCDVKLCPALPLQIPKGESDRGVRRSQQCRSLVKDGVCVGDRPRRTRGLRTHPVRHPPPTTTPTVVPIKISPVWVASEN